MMKIIDLDSSKNGYVIWETTDQYLIEWHNCDQEWILKSEINKFEVVK